MRVRMGSVGLRRHFLGLVVGVAVVLVIPTTAAAAAKWLDYPTCTATSTTITCTGRATGVPQPFNNPLAGNLSPLEAGLAFHARYVCIDALGNPLYSIFDRPVPWSDYWNTVSIKNGQTFTMSASPPDLPQSMSAQNGCLFGTWTRDPNYYDVSVDIGWGFGAPSGAVTILTGPVGTVIAP